MEVLRLQGGDRRIGEGLGERLDDFRFRVRRNFHFHVLHGNLLRL
jgi:hypothetical protein